MKMNKLLLGVALTLSIGGNAQLFNAVYNTGANYDDEAFAFDVDDDGNMFTAGIFETDTDMDPGADDYELLSVDYSEDVFVQKLDAEGNFVWAKSFGGPGDEVLRDLHVAADGSVYVTGHFEGTCDFDPGEDSYELTAVGFIDAFVVKLNSNGDFAWAISIGGESGDEGNTITTDSEGNVYTSGTFSWGTVDFDPGPGINELTTDGFSTFIQKLDEDGNFEWVKELASTNWTTPNEMKFDDAGNFYLCGGFRGECDFDLGDGEAILTEDPGGSSYDGFVLKMNADFEYVWARQIRGQRESSCNDIAIDSDGNVIMLGSYIGDTDLNPGDGDLLVTTDTEIWQRHLYLVKLDENGVYIWAKPFEATQSFFGGAVVTDYTGNLWITGSFKGEADFDPSAAVESETSSSQFNGYLLKINPEGDYLFHQRIESSYSTSGMDLKADLSGTIYAVGSFKATVDFDPSDAVVEETAINNNAYLLLLDTECELTSTISRDGAMLSAEVEGHNYQWINCEDNSLIEGETNQTFTPIENGNYACIIDNGNCHVISDCIAFGDVGLVAPKNDYVRLYPNPFHESAILEFKAGEVESINVMIYDMRGNIVYEVYDINTNKWIIDKNDLSMGMYHLVVFDNVNTTQLYRTKLIVE